MGCYDCRPRQTAGRSVEMPTAQVIEFILNYRVRLDEAQ